jgi:hypothetical protein
MLNSVQGSLRALQVGFDLCVVKSNFHIITLHRQDPP